MIYLLDTTIISALMRSLQRRDPHIAAWIATVDASDLGTSALVVREVWDGIVKVQRDHRKAAQAAVYARQVADLFDTFDERILPVSRAVAEMWAALLPGHSKHSMDAGIAATARVHGLVMVTRNMKDFMGLGVPVLDPFQSPPATYAPAL